MSRFRMDDPRITPLPYTPPRCECGNRINFGDSQCKSCRQLASMIAADERDAKRAQEFREQHLLWMFADHGERSKCACCGRMMSSHRIQQDKKYCPPCEEHISGLIMSLL